MGHTIIVNCVLVDIRINIIHIIAEHFSHDISVYMYIDESVFLDTHCVDIPLKLVESLDLVYHQDIKSATDCVET